MSTVGPRPALPAEVATYNAYQRQRLLVKPDNAAAESFFKTLKRELAEERSYGTRDEAEQGIFKHIELYCNGARMHSALGYMSSVEYERQYA